MANKPLGQLLIELGYISNEQMKVALDIQKVHKKYLGEILQSFDFVTSSEIAHAVSIQNNMEYVDLSKVAYEDSALKLIQKNIATSKSILPYKLRDQDLHVIISDPVTDLPVLDMLKRSLRLNIIPAIGDKNELAREIRLRYYELENPIEVEIERINRTIIQGNEIDATELTNPILNNAVIDRVTDIHITPDSLASHVFYRIDGVLKHYFSLPATIHKQLVAKIKILSNLDIAESRLPQDGSFEHTFINEELDVRASTLPTAYGENIVLRLLQKSAALYSLDALGFSQANIGKIEKYFKKPYGTVLVVGPTGSGKTTTMYASLRKINSLQKNVLTVEDPVEYKFAFLRQTQINNKAGYTFSKAIKHFMRQDPDIMLIGEIRDEETADLAMKASLTGHLVLSTLHTNDATSTISRLIDMGVKEYIVGSSLLAIIAQRLVRQVCSHCKRAKTYTKYDLEDIGFSDRILQGGDEFTLYEAVGCKHCRDTGYKGRNAIIEILEIDQDIKEMISTKKGILEIEHYARNRGMLSLRESGFQAVLEGKTTIEEIERVII
jgi:type IV pilus assembly protein PilB